ncbi:MAG: hypothetical protein NTY45_12210 [Elusimicrobia bacterium]|nr:hypothetical protein [Elusimicrobiota bacterium]
MRPVLDRLSAAGEWLSSSKARRAALPVALAAALCCLNLWVFPKFGSFYTELCQIDLGGFFLAGLPDPGINLNMPFAEILVSAALSLGIGPDALFIILHLGVYALVFFAGCLLSGYWAGIAGLLAAGLFGGGHDLVYEQAIYTYFVLLVFVSLLLLRREKTLKNSLLCGLAAGSSLLVRSPLFLFAPLAALCGRPGDGESRAAFARRSLVLVAACYALLLPWGVLNRSVTGRFRMFDEQRSSNNVVTAAMGSIYTAYGDTWKAAGLSPADSALKFYFGEVARRPLFHAFTVLRRLWHIFLFYPALLALFLLALVLAREREKRLLFCLPVYFILIHVALAVEKRYFYPLSYLLPPLLAGVLLPRPARDFPETDGLARKGVSAAFWAAFAGVLCVEALVLAYPWRAARSVPASDTYARASARFPGDRKLYGLKCTELWLNGRGEAYRGCLAEYGHKFRDTAANYFLAVVDSASPAAVPFPRRDDAHGDIDLCYAVKMLREFELGDRTAALVSLKRAYNELNPPQAAADWDWQHMEPYGNDRELRDFIKADTDWFWDGTAARALAMWPAQRLPKLLSAVSGGVPLTPRLSRLSGMLKGVRFGGARDGELREMIRDALTRPPGFTRGSAGSPRDGAFMDRPEAKELYDHRAF